MAEDFDDLMTDNLPRKRGPGPRQAPFAKDRAASAAPVKEPRMPQVGQLRTMQNERIDGQKWDVMIYAGENARDQFVDLAVNGHNIRIKRGEWVRVDECYVEVLRNAVVETYSQDAETGAKTPMRRLMYPFESRPVSQAA